jgi:heat shock protein HslJ
MERVKRLFLYVILGMLVFTGCSRFPGIDKGPLKDTSWQLVSFAGNAPLEGSGMTIDFSSKEIQGNASCNHYFGSYEIRGDEVSITGLGWTEMACLDPEGIMEQEQILMGLLSKAAGFYIAGNTLHITTSTGEVLTFEKSSMGE